MMQGSDELCPDVPRARPRALGQMCGNVRPCAERCGENSNMKNEPTVASALSWMCGNVRPYAGMCGEHFNMKNEPTAARVATGMCANVRECAAVCGGNANVQNGPTGAHARRIVTAIAILAIVVAVFLPEFARADEGMWLPDHPPVEILKQRYGFEPSPQWLEHAQKSAVNFGGASGSFVSRAGLVLTNHHVGSWIISKLSTPQRDLRRSGFYAPTRGEEMKCPETELNVLWSTQDVTADVVAGTENLPPAEQFKVRRKRMLTIEKESEEKSGLNSRVVTLYGGGKYHLYRSRKFTDVRLVFAPEDAIAAFGGDVDNFEYPRVDLDFAIFRVYDEKTGQPVHPEHFLKWSRDGAKESELLLVFGHPGRTSRLFTYDHVTFDRDVELPMRLESLWRREVQLHSFIDRGPDNARMARADMFGVQNSRKSRTGALAALLDPQFLARKQEDERALRAFVDRDPQAKARWGDAWTKIAASRKVALQFQARSDALHPLRGYTDYGGLAHQIVQLVAEREKPNAERLPESGDADLDSLMVEIYSPLPIEERMEIDRFASGLSYAAERLGADDPLVKKMLDGKSPRARAEQLVRGTKLKDVAYRRQLVDGGVAAVNASDDPIIRLFVTIDPELRALRKRSEDDVQAVERENYAKIAAAQFAMKGESAYPDATGTLRIAFGAAKGYHDDDLGGDVPAFTTVHGLYARWRERGGPRREEPPFFLPPRWVRAEKKINRSTPVNFVLTADIVGGNSGSPVINRAGELVGLIFDGNLQGLGSSYAYDERQGRAIAVDARGIVEALRIVYGAAPLADELTRR